ncbi:MAG: aerotolerance regulator BatA [Elusimicrobia bacterium RIFOXYB12_FULL_50_12]|nr:MAG: aerotolerance regulator BatA [Elusimicrobia bacterium RIFOXYA12_FULL_49_49]OGS16390.1 MAG: aerotolerance regulator BatA [Elusimicrobia bacterium RIFOXYA2_FULL_47_53]OGS27233.1 MAG: aerotolerance regulator BatA [Elusimicrobia bacterium RIFOXYB12_FULL_50_12]OGS30433.1 MAG: aerotolerance regulator BatA [Elusimicrobia bacterium RIFOXYB2_FULL_46_23]
MRFANPIFLLLLAALPLLYWYFKRRANRREPALLFPDFTQIENISPSARVKLAFLPKLLRYAALALFIAALARPQAGQKSEEIENLGIDIMLVLDTSTSMKAIDFRPANRFEAAKKVSREFVKGRAYDKIGIVVFSGFAYTQCPLTADHDSVLNFLDNTEIGMTTVDGTAIGSAIATAANRLKTSSGKSRVMILVTDGRNNMGEIDPLTASQAAAALGIKIYTIGAGQPGGALYPVDDPFFGRRYVKMPEQELDEDTLAKIAETTDGRYFRATDTKSLEKIFQRINTMEKTEIKTTKYTNYNELFGFFIWPAFLLLALELLLSKTWLRRLP